ncbi:hypothetical protein FLAVO9AF_130228 [Flavobacterium sp. 9AF]|nr:hypothetical protein [Flavobacterium sp. 9AF]VXB33693.1 hypothetical protein FLAVO9AF_130228 [Flavobacterium sp. 9AF]
MYKELVDLKWIFNQSLPKLYENKNKDIKLNPSRKEIEKLLLTS